MLSLVTLESRDIFNKEIVWTQKSVIGQHCIIFDNRELKGTVTHKCWLLTFVGCEYGGVRFINYWIRVRSRQLDIGQVSFCVYRDWGEVEVLKTLLPTQKRIYSIAKIFCFNKSQEWLVYFWALGEEANCDLHNNSSRVHDKVATRTITVAKCTKLAQSYPVYAYLSWLTCPAFVWFSLIWPNTQRKLRQCTVIGSLWWSLKSVDIVVRYTCRPVAPGCETLLFPHDHQCNIFVCACSTGHKL